MSKTATRRREAARRRIKAMSNPERHEILKCIRDKSGASPVEVARHLDLDLNTVAYNVRELAKIDYVTLTDTAPVRGAVEHFYAATEQALIDTEEWAELSDGERLGLLVDFMQPLVDDFTEGVRSGVLGSDGDWIITRTPIHSTDRQGFEEMRAAHLELFDRITKIQTDSLTRLERTGDESISVSSGQTCFEVPGF